MAKVVELSNPTVTASSGPCGFVSPDEGNVRTRVWAGAVLW